MGSGHRREQPGPTRFRVKIQMAAVFYLSSVGSEVDSFVELGKNAEQRASLAKFGQSSLWWRYSIGPGGRTWSGIRTSSASRASAAETPAVGSVCRKAASAAQRHLNVNECHLTFECLLHQAIQDWMDQWSGFVFEISNDIYIALFADLNDSEI